MIEIEIDNTVLTKSLYNCLMNLLKSDFESSTIRFGDPNGLSLPHSAQYFWKISDRDRPCRYNDNAYFFGVVVSGNREFSINKTINNFSSNTNYLSFLSIRGNKLYQCVTMFFIIKYHFLCYKSAHS